MTDVRKASHSRCKKQPLVPRVKYALGTPEHKFELSFCKALNVTKGYTLSRDVKDCVVSALRREKRIG